jgi:hypothetical protein
VRRKSGGGGQCGRGILKRFGRAFWDVRDESDAPQTTDARIDSAWFTERVQSRPPKGRLCHTARTSFD